MNRKIALYVSLAIIILFIVFMIYDTTKDSDLAIEQNVYTLPDKQYEEMWEISGELDMSPGKLKAVATLGDFIFLGGESFLSSYSDNLEMIWNKQLEFPVMAISVYGDTIFVSTGETIVLFSTEGDELDEWGPFDENSIITGIAANDNYVAFSDAGNKEVFVLNKEGALVSIVGQPGNQFVIPSPYFDVAFSPEGLLVTANPGKRNVEFRNIGGNIINYFGEAGIALEYFCGCCNPSNFAFMQDGNIVTAEKGINRIKILDKDGNLIELVAQPEHFLAPIPVDLAVGNNNLIYAANPADSKLYVFKRR